MSLFGTDHKTVSVAPFVVFRWLFGAVVLYGGLVSVLKGDIQERFLKPQFYFKYWGWEWVQAPSDAWIYGAYGLWLVGALGLMLGAFYRWSVTAFFVGFTYLHLLDATNYINHYYLISILAVFMWWVPAQAQLSIDHWRGKTPDVLAVPIGFLYSFRLQFAIVYFFAGVAKLNSDWLLQALPLKIWLLQKADFPVLGTAFTWYWTPFIFSWAAAFYDLTIAGWLLWRRSRPIAYAFVLAFHLLTGLLFDIGLFPPLMIIGTLFFFSPQWHERILALCRQQTTANKQQTTTINTSILKPIAIAFFAFQVLFPLRHWVLYSGDVRWTEEGYRWGWRVMLFEKEGNATFYVVDSSTQRHWTVDNSAFLTPFQIKQMSTKPDHIRQFACYLREVYSRAYHLKNPMVYADVFVTYNARPSRRLVPEKVNLCVE